MNPPIREVTSHGRKEPFEFERLVRSIQRSALAVGQADPRQSEEWAALVCELLEHEFPGDVPTPPDIRELSLKVLLELGSVEVARHHMQGCGQPDRAEVPPAEVEGGALHLGGLAHPTRALGVAVSYPLGTRSGNDPLRELVSWRHALRSLVTGPVHIVGLGRVLAARWSDELDARHSARALALALCGPTRTVLDFDLALSDRTLGSMFRRGGDPRRAAALHDAFLSELCAQVAALSESVEPAVLVLSIESSPRPGSRLDVPLLRCLTERGLLQWRPGGPEPRKVTVTGARVGINLLRPALNAGPGGSPEFLQSVSALAERAVAAGTRRLGSLLDLDRAGTGPLARLSSEAPVEIAPILGDAHYTCALLPLGLEASVEAILGQRPGDSQIADCLATEVFEAVAQALPEHPGSGAGFEICRGLDGEHSRLQLQPRENRILRLSQDGQSFIETGDGHGTAIGSAGDPVLDTRLSPDDPRLAFLVGSNSSKGPSMQSNHGQSNHGHSNHGTQASAP